MHLEATNRRNAAGVKWSADCFRNIGGEHYVQWTSFISDEMVQTYRAAGIKCRRAAGELFVRKADAAKAAAIDEARKWN